MARGHLIAPPSVTEAKHQFIVASDAVRAWIDGFCAVEPEVFTSRADLFTAYQSDTLLDGSKQLSNREFYNRVGQIAGISAFKRDGIRGFKGIRHMTPVELAVRERVSKE